MATFSFPTSPSLNQLYTFNGKTWKYNGTGWALVTNVDAAQSAWNTANLAYIKSNTSTVLAQAAYDSSNTKFSSSGGTITGPTTISSNVTISGNNSLIVTGNLNVLGTTTTTQAQNFSLSNAMFSLHTNNTLAPLTNNDGLNIGLAMHYYDTADKQAILVRDNPTGYLIWYNTSTNLAGNTDSKGITMGTFQTNALIANTATISGIELGVFANAAYGQANTGTTLAQAAYNSGNTTLTYAQSAYGLANTNSGAITVIQGVNTTQNTSITNLTTYSQAAYGLANSTTTYAQAAYGQANTGTTLAQAAYNSGNTTLTYAQSAYGLANATTTYAQAAYGLANSTTTYAQSAYGLANNTTTYAQAAYGKANTGVTIAQAAYDTANTKLSSSGGTVTGNVTFSTDGNGVVYSNAFTTSISYTTSSNNVVAIDTFSKTAYRSAKYLVQITYGSQYHMVEINLIHDGTTVWISEYGEIVTNQILATFDGNITGGNVNLLIVPVNNDYPSTIKMVRTAVTI